MQCSMFNDAKQLDYFRVWLCSIILSTSAQHKYLLTISLSDLFTISTVYTHSFSMLQALILQDWINIIFLSLILFRRSESNLCFNKTTILFLIKHLYCNQISLHSEN